MTRSLFIRSLSLLAALAAARATATTIDFDDIPGGPGARLVDPDRYQALGVRLSVDAGLLYAFDFNPATLDTPPTAIYGSDDGGVTARRPVIVEFVLPSTTTPAVVDIASFFVADVGGPTQDGVWSAAVYDLGNSLLDTISSDAPTMHLSFTQPGKIHKVVFTPSGESESFDTLAFFPRRPYVPEPATLRLLGLACLPLVARRRFTMRNNS